MPEFDDDDPTKEAALSRLPDPSVLLKYFDPTLFIGSKGVIAALVSDPMDFPSTLGIAPDDWVPHRASNPCSLVLCEAGDLRLLGARLPCGHFDTQAGGGRIVVVFGAEEGHRTIVNGAPMTPHSLGVGSSSTRCVANWPIGPSETQAFFTFSVPADRVPPEWVSTDDLFRIYEATPLTIRAIRRLAIEALLAAAGGAPDANEPAEAALGRLFDAITDALRRAQRLPPPPALGARGYLDVVDRIDGYLAANPTEPIRLEDMAATLKVSRRTIHNVMMRVRGLTLLSYVRLMRLRAVRRDLLYAPDVRLVKQAAMRNGFMHQGRFSKDYADLFGESPSATLERRSTSR